MERVRTSLRRFLETDVREGDWVTVVAPEQQLWWTARNAWEYRQLAGVVGRLVGQGAGDSYGDWASGARPRVRHCRGSAACRPP